MLGLRSPLLGEDFDRRRPDPARKPRRRGRAQAAAGPASVNSREPRREGRSKHRVLEAARAYFILAGPAGNDRGTFELYKWPAEESDPPTPVPGFSAALQKLDKFQPEALVVGSTGKKIHLLSDDGDSCNIGAPAFRGVAVTLD